MNRKPIFDYIRRLLGRALRQSEVDALDQTIDDALTGTVDNSKQDTVPAVPPRSIGAAGIQLIKDFEGFARLRPDGLVEAYPDPATGADPWTIGWGSTGPGIGPQTVWTREQAEARFVSDLASYAADVDAAIGDRPTTQNQFDALVSFHYNTGAIKRATLTEMHRDGRFEEAAQEFGRWKYANGRVLSGLIRRREAEKRLYQS